MIAAAVNAVVVALGALLGLAFGVRLREGARPLAAGCKRQKHGRAEHGG